MAVWDVDADGAEETATLCRDRHGVVAHWSVVDVADTSAIEDGVARAADALGSLGGFVHAAGVSGADVRRLHRRRAVGRHAQRQPPGRGHDLPPC